MTHDKTEPDNDDPRLNRVLAEFLDAERLGQAANEADLVKQHPDLAGPLRSFFADRAQFQKLAGSIAARKTNLPPGDVTVGADAKPNGSKAIRYFGDFVLLQELARGGMGVVYKARQV